MDPSSSFFRACGIGNETQFGFGAGLGQRTRIRRKPRFIKLRKNDRTVRGTSFSGEILSGFNPFVPPSTGSVNDNVESPGDKHFVFGANGNTSGAKATSTGNVPVTPTSDEEEFGTPIGDFGSEVRKEHSDGVSRKIDNDYQENIRPYSKHTSFVGKNGLRFGGSENESSKSVKNSDASEENSRRQNGIDKNTSESNSCFDNYRKSNSVQNADKTIGGFDFSLPADMKNLNISDTGIHSGKGYEEARKSNNTPDFVFGSFGKVDDEHKGAATSGPCSFSSNGFHQSGNAAARRPTFHPETTDINNLTSTTFGTRTSFEGFKVPQWDPYLFKNSLFPDVNRNPVHARRNRIPKDKRSKKLKEKMKQREPDLCNDQASEGIESQENLSSSGYSPMDFSPYRGEKPSDQFPTETPLTSIDPSHLRDVSSRSSNEFMVASARDPSVLTAEDHGSSCMPNFSFSASTCQGEIPNKKLQAVKKYRRKANNCFSKNNIYANMRNNQENQPVNTGQAKLESGSTSVLPDVCEVWRLRYHILTQEIQHWRFLNNNFLKTEKVIICIRGNQAYKNGDICKAEECYTNGINSSPSRDSSEYSVKPHALCYGNRAAARISLGRLREAISDCEMAASLDPSYIKAYKRAAK